MMTRTTYLLLIAMIWSVNLCFSQNTPILNYSVNSIGQVQLEIEGSSDKYYILTARHAPNQDYESVTSITMGVDGLMTISEPLNAYPLENYKITAYDLNNPGDIDGDGKDDIEEFNNMPTQAPLNYAREIPFNDGAPSVPTREVFEDLAVVEEEIFWAPFLNNQEFVKFAIVNQSSDEPEVYFINSKTHAIHANFLNTINVDQFGDDVTTGEVVYNPNVILPNGAIGSYNFNYSFGDAVSFRDTRETFELLARSMPFLQNNLQHFISSDSEDDYNNQYKDDYEGSRINVVLESGFFEDVDFLPFNKAEGYGLFRQMTLDDNPGSRDIVLYDALPNSLPRVGGIITSVIQTPLSHVNLRAIQDNLPNAYIKDPLTIDSIANLLDKYIYYKVTDDSYEIREATLEEVNAWYEKLRPTEAQIPDRDLSFTEILPLDSIGFEMSTAFGAKCSNVATMRTFGFPEGTIPNGFGVPFYYYDEFMKFNGFYDKITVMLNDPEFISDLETRIDMLKEFRKEIKDADMPQWMLDDLQEMHDSFPEGTSVRCRSSTNNEDLPGFSGAGLYTSKTQHPDEGHMSKSIKQVYASMWNFRAFDERDFYRVDHYIAAMGVLCHPNYQEEKSNGVGVSLDPIYNTDNTFYLNTQVGEFLITNPDANSIPEEIILNEDPEIGYFVLRNSNLVPDGELVMEDVYINLLREYLRTIHDEFAVLYNVVGAEGFGMDIEYKVTADDRLIIKQARPWVSFWADIKANIDLSVIEIKEPTSSASLGDSEIVEVEIGNTGLRPIGNFDISLAINEETVETIEINETLEPQQSADYSFTLPQDMSVIGDYNLSVSVSHPEDGYSNNDTLDVVISNLHLIEGGIVAASATAKCGAEVEVIAQVTNYGESTFTNTQIEVKSNGIVVEVVEYNFSIPYLSTVNIPITITENLQTEDNILELTLLNINNQADAISDNNNSMIEADLESEFNTVTLIINPDDYPQETTWELINNNTNSLVVSGDLNNSAQQLSEDICIDYNDCYTLIIYDSADDGLCCAFGEGDFLMINAMGDTLFTNGGEFGSSVEEVFCPASPGCLISIEINVSNSTDENIADGIIVINPITGTAPFLYSIDGGNTFSGSNQFNNLLAGNYNIVVMDATENCTYQETVEIGFDIINSNTDILQANGIKIYPNPLNDILTIDLTQSIVQDNNEIHVEIYDYLGSLIKQHYQLINDGHINIAMHEIPPGSYLAKIIHGDLEVYVKLVKI